MDSFVISDKSFNSRLLLGTGKFSSNALMKEAIEASETEIVTVSLRRANLSSESDQSANILDYIDGDNCLILPNT